MKITLDHRNPSPSHCDIVVFVNGALAGTLVLRQEEVLAFNEIVQCGCEEGTDTFRGTGNSRPLEHEHFWVRRRDGRECAMCDTREYGLGLKATRQGGV